MVLDELSIEELIELLIEETSYQEVINAIFKIIET